MSHRLAPTTLTTLLLTTLATPASAIPPPPRDVLLVTTFHAAIEDDDEDALKTLVTPTARFHVSGAPQPTQNLTAFRATMQDLYEHIPDARRSYDHIFSSTTDRTAVRYRLAGTYTGLADERGKRVEVDAVEHFRFEGGRVAEHWFHFNYLQLSGQLGLKFKLPGGKP